MKILFVVSPGAGNHMGFGGAQIHVRDLARAFIKSGHEVTVATNHSTSVVEIFRDEPVNFLNLPDLVRPIDPRSDFRTIMRLREIARDFQPDIVSLHSSKPGIVGRLAMLGMPAKVLFTAHGWSFTPGVSNPARSVYLFIEYMAQFLCDKIVTVSEFDHDLAAKARFKISKLLTIHNGMTDISNKLIESNLTPEQGATKAAVNPRSLLTIARFSQQKDYETLFQALTLMRHQDATLMAIGGGDDEQTKRWKSRAEELGIADRVTFEGEIKNVYPYFQNAAVYVLSSNWEGLPRSIIEAMMMKLPVVASEVGGNRELIDHGKTGFIVPRSDAVNMAERLDYLIDNPDAAIEMGQRARERYEKKFRFSAMLREHLKLYHQLTGIELVNDSESSDMTSGAAGSEGTLATDHEALVQVLDKTRKTNGASSVDTLNSLINGTSANVDTDRSELGDTGDYVTDQALLSNKQETVS